MNGHEHEIDEILRALGAVEPAGGMEARVLARLARPATMPERENAWVWGGGLGFAIALLLLGFALAPARSPVPTAEKRQPEAAAMTAGTPPASLRGAQQRAIVPERVTRAIVPEIPSPQPSEKVVASAPSRGLADLPSMLAPPEEETSQERLLSRIAHGPRMTEAAVLNPDSELVARRREAEFIQFFPSPTPQETYLAEHTPN